MLFKRGEREPSEEAARQWLEAWQKRYEAFKSAPKVEWRVGDSVLAREEPYKGLKGTVKALDPGGERLTAALRIGGVDVPIQLHIMDVEKA